MSTFTVFTSLHNFPSFFTAFPIYPSHFLQARFFGSLAVTLLTLAHLLWIHLPHWAHKAELAFSLKLHTPHGSTLLWEKPSFVMPSLTILFPRLAFEQLLSSDYFHFVNLLTWLSRSSGLSHQHTATHLVSGHFSVSAQILGASPVKPPSTTQNPLSFFAPSY